MKVGMFIGKVKEFGISWCIPHRMAADNAKGGSVRTPPIWYRVKVGIDLGLLKKALLKTSKIIFLCSNSLARQFSSVFHAKCLLPRQSYIHQVLQTIQMKLILLCVWAEPAVLGSAKTALKFIYKI